MTFQDMETLKGLAAQIAARCVREGIAEPTKQQIDSMLTQVHLRNVSIVECYSDDVKFREIVSRGLAREMYCDAVKLGMNNA